MNVFFIDFTTLSQLNRRQISTFLHLPRFPPRNVSLARSTSKYHSIPYQTPPYSLIPSTFSHENLLLTESPRSIPLCHAKPSPYTTPSETQTSSNLLPAPGAFRSSTAPRWSLPSFLTILCHLFPSFQKSLSRSSVLNIFAVWLQQSFPSTAPFSLA